MLAFRSSERLATAYGLAVTGTLLINTMLLSSCTRRAVALGAVEAGAGRRSSFGGVELTYLAANLTKIVARRLAAAARRGDRRHRHDDLAARPADRHRAPPRRRRARCRTSSTSSTTAGSPRVPGTAVFPHPTKDTDAAGAAGQRRVQPRAARDGSSSCRCSRRTCRTCRSRRAARRSTTSATPTTASCTCRCGSASRTSRTSPQALRAGARGRRARARHRPVDDASYFLSRGLDPARPRPGMAPLAQAAVPSSHNAATRRPTSACRSTAR